MGIYINEEETQILLSALGDCRQNQIARGHKPERIQDLYSKLWDSANRVKERSGTRTYTKRKI